MSPDLDAFRSSTKQQPSLTSNGDVQLIHTITYPDIRNYHRSYLRWGADDQSRVLFRPVPSTLERM